MSALAAILIAAVPNAFMAIVAKLVTQTFLQDVMEKILIRALDKAASMTTNTLDDELAAEVKKRLQERP